MKKLLRTILAVVIALVLIAGIFLVIRLLQNPKPGEFRVKRSDTVIEAVNADADDDEIVEYAREILFAMANKDYVALASVAHADYGVIFSPYATVDLATGCFTASQIAGFDSDNTKYIWGVYDGSGEPIEMTPAEYFEGFVFDTDFTKCENFGVDEILRAGNSLENITEVFPDCRFVDCYMPNAESDESWASLRLVFEEQNGKLMLSAVVHSENTI